MYSSGVRCKQVDIFIYIVEFFQSTHSEECDNGSLWQSIATHCFNPRTPKGATYKPDSVLYFFMFQPTHPWRVRRYLSYSYIYLYMFQSTHPWRVRLFLWTSTGSVFQFQSTHPWRVQPKKEKKKNDSCVFQSTHPWRVRPYLSFSDIVFLRFNPRTHGGCGILAHTFYLPSKCFNPRTPEGATNSHLIGDKFVGSGSLHLHIARVPSQQMGACFKVVGVLSESQRLRYT